MRIAIDAMGGDNAPDEIVRGAADAASELGVGVVLVGDKPRIERVLKTNGVVNIKGLEILHARDEIKMDEHPAGAVRKKKDSSIVRAVGLVKEGLAKAVISAGNTGASMTASILLLGRINGIDRPALAGILPNKSGYTLLLDVGANVDCKPKNLLQFAVMGRLYARNILGIANPRVGLLSIGEEDCKGNELTLAVLPMLQKQDINFIGNVEGQNIFDGSADVIVCDGFVGNIVLKAGEALAKQMALLLADGGEGPLVSDGGAWRKRMDYRRYGGAPFLGVNGVSVVCHGNSNSLVIKNAVRLACESVNRDIVNAIHEHTAHTLTPGC